VTAIPGPAAVYIAFALALYVWHVGAALLGVFFADLLGISDGSLDLKSDGKKMSLCSLIALTLFFSLFYFAKSPMVFMVYLLTFMISLKLAYLGANHGFLLLVVGSTLAGMIVFVPVIKLLRLPGAFFLYVVALIAFLARQWTKKRGARASGEAGKLREDAVRRRVRQDPDFSTFCYQCAHFHQHSGRCLLQIDGHAVTTLTIGQRSYCTSFDQPPAEPQMPQPPPTQY
jgi:hypothetical protein